MDRSTEEVSDKDTDFKFGWMGNGVKGTGRMINLMETHSYSNQTATDMSETSLIINLMERECFNLNQKDINIKDNGKMD